MAAPTPKDPRVGAFLEDGSGMMWQGDKWILEQRLGSGRFASVFKLSCASNPSRPTLAAKVTTLQGISAWARAQLTEELAIWQTLRHPNVVRLHGYLSDKTKHVLLLELARGGELFERIVSMQFFSEQLAARQVGQVNARAPASSNSSPRAHTLEHLLAWRPVCRSCPPSSTCTASACFTAT